jgi:hypothetical protein
MKFKIKHTGIWSAAAWLPRFLCYRPAEFFHHPRLIAQSFPQGEILLAFKKMLFHSFAFSKSCVSEIKSRSVCTKNLHLDFLV